MSDKLDDFLDPKGDNFLGTGLSVQDLMFEGRLKTIENSFPTLMGPEKKHRLHIILSLSAELQRIKKINMFGTASGEMAVESVINGDWTDVKMWAESLKFKEEDPSWTSDSIELWKDFVSYLEMAEFKGVLN